MDYFSHDNKMRNDRKIKALRAKFGLQGYAVFNMFLELLCEAELLVIEWNEMERELISGDFGLPADELEEITNYLVHIDLLQRSNGWLYCENLDKRSDNVFDKRTRNLDSLRIENGVNIAETHVSIAESTQSKVKNSKEEKSIGLPDDEFKEVIEEWLQYKKEKGQAYKPKGLKEFISHIRKISNNNPVTAKAIIKQSMRNNWAGIFELKEERKQQPNGDNIPRLDIGIKGKTI